MYASTLSFLWHLEKSHQCAYMLICSLNYVVEAGVAPGAGPGPNGGRRRPLITKPEQPGEQKKRDALAEYHEALRKQVQMNWLRGGKDKCYWK